MDAKKGYVNPVPAIDAGKTFELRLVLNYDELLSVEQARLHAAEFLLEQDAATLSKWIQCVKIEALYPSDLSRSELARLGYSDCEPCFAQPNGSGTAKSDRALLSMLKQACKRYRDQEDGCPWPGCQSCPVDALMAHIKPKDKTKEETP